MNNDLISRQQAFDALHCRFADGFEEDRWWNSTHVIAALKGLPAVPPERKTGRWIPNNWIPCSERLPEERVWIGTKMFGTTISDEVYVTFEAPDGQRFTKHISFQNGKLSPADEKTMQVWFKGAKPIAWKQQPEPYQGGGEADE